MRALGEKVRLFGELALSTERRIDQSFRSPGRRPSVWQRMLGVFYGVGQVEGREVIARSLAGHP